MDKSKHLESAIKTHQITKEEALLQKFKDKNLIVTGKIESIESGIADMPYIMLKAGGDMEFMKPQAHFNKEDTPVLAKLKKGQAIKLQCVGNGEVGGMPMLKDCKVL